MLNPKLMRLPTGEMGAAQAVDLDRISPWAPTVAQAREAILRHYVVGNMMEGLSLPIEVARFAPTQKEVEELGDICFEAVRRGRMIDFGDWPNAVIKTQGQRGGILFNQGLLPQPFREPWVLYHTWEGAVGLYVVNPVEPERADGDCEVAELAPCRVMTDGVLMIGDRVIVQPVEAVSHGHADRYAALAIPSMFRYLPGAEAMNNNGSPESAAAGNVLDPLMTALLILSTRNMVRETIVPPEKVNRARAKRGHPLIPPYDRVDSAPYVTAILARGRARGEDQGGTHASPTPHVRRGHIREYAPGRQTFVRDALVNFHDDAKRGRIRSHYTVR